MFTVKKKPVWCPVCHGAMTNVEHWRVSDFAVKEFARLNKWALLSKNGWHRCPDCDICIHKPTVDEMGK